MFSTSDGIFFTNDMNQKQPEKFCDLHLQDGDMSNDL
jgi:hypothetical protein